MAKAPSPRSKPLVIAGATLLACPACGNVFYTEGLDTGIHDGILVETLCDNGHRIFTETVLLVVAGGLSQAR